MKRIGVTALLVCSVAMAAACGRPITSAAAANGGAVVETDQYKLIWYWQRNIVRPMLKSDNFLIHVRYRQIDDDSLVSNYSIGKAKRMNVCFVDHTSVRFTKKGFITVDENNQTVVVGKKKGELYEDAYSNYFVAKAEFFRSFFIPIYLPNFVSMRDTTLGGVEYKVLEALDTFVHRYNPQTDKFDIPIYHNVYYYYNLDKHLLDYICAIPTDVDRNMAFKEEFWLDYDFEDHSAHYADVFDIKNERYAYYDFYDDNNNPPSVITLSSSATATDSVLNFPIVNLNGDTTSIAELDGWLLLDLWMFGCRPCYDWMNKVDIQRQSPEGFKPDAEGIRLVNINVLSNNSERIMELAHRYHAEKSMYHAKGLSTVLRLNSVPQFYLISPDKQVVYTSAYLNDYKELIEAKNQYTLTHTKK